MRTVPRSVLPPFSFDAGLAGSRSTVGELERLISSRAASTDAELRSDSEEGGGG